MPKKNPPPSPSENVRQLHSNPPVVTKQLYAGPIPPASELQKYETILPGLANRIMTMAETQSNHRQECEKIVLQNDTSRLNAEIFHQRRRDCEAKIGQFSALLITFGFIISGSYVATHGSPLTGGFISIAALASIVTAFIRGRDDKKDNSKAKAA